MAELTQTSLSGALKTQYERRLLSRAVARLPHGRWANKASLNGYGSLEFRKYGSLSVISNPLTEGGTPAEQPAVALTLVTVTPKFYGAWIGYSDELELSVFDPLVSEISGILGEQAGVSADTLIRNALTAGATKDYSGDQTARANLDAPAHNITWEDFLKGLAVLLAADSLPISGQRYICIQHINTYMSLFLDPTFVNLFQEAGPTDDSNPMRSGFMGTIMNCDIYVTSNGRSYDQGGVGNDDVYSMLFLGAESHGVVGMGNLLPSDMDAGGPGIGQPLTGKRVQPVRIIAKQLGSAGTEDPLDQRATLAWKMALEITILNSAWIVDLEHTNNFSED